MAIEMKSNTILLSAIFIPMAGAFILPAVGLLSARLRNAVAFTLIASSVAAGALMLPKALSGNIVSCNIIFPLGFNMSFGADNLALFMALVSSTICAIIVFYSFGYISHYPNQNEYYMMVVLFMGSMMGLIFSQNLIFLYLFWEITAIACWRLIGFFREKDYILKADKAFLVTIGGALVMLIGFILIYQRTGSFELSTIRTYYRFGRFDVSSLAVALILFGIFSKSATLPFHTWLPDAGVAPSPVTALLHAAILVKIGVYVYARLFVATLPIEAVWHTAVPVIAAISALVSAGAALVEKDMKRLIAYSTVSQIAFIFLGLSVGSDAGILGGLLYILMHGLAKGGLFLCAGVVEQNVRTKDITKMGGLIRTMPVTAISFLVCAFSVMGIPPFGGFFSKFLVFSGTIDSGHWIIALVFMIGAAMTILYLLRAFNLIFLGNATNPVKEGSGVMVASVAMLAAASLLCAIFIKYPFEFASLAVKQMVGI
jgi:NADH:ubiquinone oxidoreductase subunit 5 (subunit L)/multisubunit Na+/H+ antiporter MnhA subunit